MGGGPRAAEKTIPPSPLPPSPPQAPMSRLEPTEFINDRYARMEENLQV